MRQRKQSGRIRTMLSATAGLVAITVVGAVPAIAAPDLHSARSVRVMRDLDRDGVPDRRDRDRDGDGIPNVRDRRPNQRDAFIVRRRPGWGVRANAPARYANDLDRDGIPNAQDRDRDGDGVRNARDRYPNDARRR